MPSDEVAHIQALLDDPVFIENFHQKLAEENAAAPECENFCGFRCEAPFGDGKKCLVCLSKPTSECMRTIVY